MASPVGVPETTAGEQERNLRETEPAGDRSIPLSEGGVVKAQIRADNSYGAPINELNPQPGNRDRNESPEKRLPQDPVSPNRPAENSSEEVTTPQLQRIFGLDVTSVEVFPLSNYTFGKKDSQSRGMDARAVISEEALQKHLESRYNERGMRRAVAAVLLVHAHEFPHILLLQRSSGEGGYCLPGGRLRPGEAAEDGLRRKLQAKLSPVDGETDWEIGEAVSKWWDIDYSRRMYPYVPSHVSKPKENLIVYSVALPEKFMFAVPKNLQLVAVPLFELFSNASEYGNVIAAVPSLLSRFHVNYA